MVTRMNNPLVTCCTDLTIDSTAVQPLCKSNTGLSFVWRNLLRHFPSLKSLTLVGCYLPLLSCLPAPEKLKKLNLANIYATNEQTRVGWKVDSIVVNFAALQMLRIENEQVCGYQLDTICKTDVYLSVLTGVRWLESVTRHLSSRLHEIRFRFLTLWAVAALKLAQACRSLTVTNLWMGDSELVSELRNRGVSRYLPKVTHLTVFHLVEKDIIAELLPLFQHLETLLVTVIPRDGGMSRERRHWMDHTRQHSSSTLKIFVKFY